MANRKFEFDTDGFQYYNDNYVKHPSKSVTTGTSGAHPYNGMGRIVLKKNMVSNVNTLTQAMINTANTIYVIQYDYTLGEDITVPANCILEFDGGSISGVNTLTGNNTRLINSTKNIFNGVNIAGIWIVPYISSDFFADAHQVNRLQNAFKLLNADIQNTIVVEEGDYYEETFTTGYGTPSVGSNTHLIINGTIHLTSNNATNYHIINVQQYSKNVHISGKGGLEGDRATNTSDGEWGHGIWFADVSDILIEGITISMCFGDALNFYRHAEKVEVRRCTFNYCGRVGISIYTCNSFSIHDNMFIGIGRPYNNRLAKLPATAIVVEGDGVPTHDSGPVDITNNHFYDCSSCIAFGGPWTVYGIHVDNNVIQKVYQGISIGVESQGLPQGGDYKDISVTNNYIDDLEERAIQIDGDGCIVSGNIIYQLEGQANIEASVRIRGSYNRVCHNIIKAPQCLYVYDMLGDGHNYIAFNKCESYGEFERYICVFVPSNKNGEFAYNTIIGESIIGCNDIHDNQFTLIDNRTYMFVEVDCYDVRVYNNIIKSTATNPSDLGIISRGCTGKMWNNRFERVIAKYFDYGGTGFNAILEDEVTRGTTSERPNIGAYSLKANYAGFEYYDTTLNKKIMWNGTGWVNVDGSVLS